VQLIPAFSTWPGYNGLFAKEDCDALRLTPLQIEA